MEQNVNLFKTGSVMDYVGNATTVDPATQSIEEAAIKNQKILNIPRKTRTIVREYTKVGRNDLCPCGSGKKYKHCCLNSNKLEGYHELSAMEMADVKNNNVQLSSFTKNPNNVNQKEMPKRKRTKKRTQE